MSCNFSFSDAVKFQNSHSVIVHLYGNMSTSPTGSGIQIQMAKDRAYLTSLTKIKLFDLYWYVYT